jgi:predicted ATPase/DNA-binding winged helix-turn-helix (wHTH) protein
MAGAVDLRFGRFQLRRRQRMLLADGAPVDIGGRAIDVLLALIDADGVPVSKDDLLARVWPAGVVEEHNLTVQINALRRALGADRELIRTIPRLGYCFTGEAVDGAAIEAPTPTPAPAVPHRRAAAGNLPATVDPLIGREVELPELLELQMRCRLLSLTGPGGIGKTRLALEVARGLAGRFAHGVWLVELASATDPEMVPLTIATLLGLQLGANAHSPARIGAVLAGADMLLVLDNCEHLIEAAARTAEALLQGAGNVRILATSREPLRVDGEFNYRVPPLVVTGEAVTDAAAISTCGAVELFIARARAANVRFTAGDAELPAIGTICRRLDGIPLAIELAAARAASLGVEVVAARLDDHLGLLTSGRRTALPRHQTLRATLDWSYDLLTEPERRVLRSLAIFTGDFTLTAASAIASQAAAGEAEALECIVDLVAKSLVVVDSSAGERTFQLLATMRAYALEKLIAAGERNATARRHAAYCLARFRDAEGEWETHSAAEWTARHRPLIGNLRAALAWCFSPGGDRATGVALAAASAQLWLELSMLVECCAWTGSALDALDAADRGTRAEMVLQCAFGISLMFTRGLSEARIALHAASELAERLGDVDYQMRALAGLASSCHRLEEFEEAVRIGRRAQAMASGSDDPFAQSTAAWILGVSHLFLGHFDAALEAAGRTRRLTLSPAVRRAHMVRLGRDGYISASCSVAQALSMKGLLNQSAELAREILAEAPDDHPLSFCLALSWCGCQIPLWHGNLLTAAECAAVLKEHALRHDLNSYVAYGLGFEGQLRAEQGDLGAAELLLRSCLERLRQSRSGFYLTFTSTLATILAKAGRGPESLEAASEAVDRAERNHHYWHLPEALRIKGEALLATDAPAEAEACFRRSLALAHEQGALFWELRSAINLARQGGDGAHDLLRGVYDRFTEGFNAPDRRAARRLLESHSD